MVWDLVGKRSNRDSYFGTKTAGVHLSDGLVEESLGEQNRPENNPCWCFYPPRIIVVRVDDFADLGGSKRWRTTIEWWWREEMSRFIF